MSWDTIAWKSAEQGFFEAVPALGSMWPLLKSALEEAVSASIQGPATVGDLLVAEIDAADLPAEFEPVASFELLGTERRGLWTALAPDQGAILGGVPQTPLGLQQTLLEGLDSVVQAMVGEGLSVGPADPTPLSGPLELIRVPIRDAGGAGADSIIAVGATVPGERTAHIVALQALNEPSASQPADGPAAAESSPTAGLSAPAAHAAPASSPAPASPPVAAEPQIPVRPLPLPELSPTPPAPGTRNIELLLGVNLEVSVEIGRANMAIRDVLALAPGSVVELDKLAGEKVDVLVNGRPIASGEVVVADENFGVRITDVASRQHRILSADAPR